MALMIASDKCIVTAKELIVDFYDYSDHKNIEVPVNCKANEKDYISDIAVSNDGKYLALITTISKQLMMHDLHQMKHVKTFVIPRSASRIRFTIDDAQILVADKSGDVLLYEIKEENTGTKLLGHLSLLLDVLQTRDSKYVITSDRDEKIRVSCYPNTYNIQTYCLGHKEFVNHIELLPHNSQYLTSSSGDGTVKIWNYEDGKLHHTIDTACNVNDDQLKQNFINMMDEGGIEVLTLPIVHFVITSINKDSSIIALTVHTFNAVLIYSISNQEKQFSHKLEYKLELERFPSAINLFNDTLFVYDDTESNVNVYKLLEIDGKLSVEAKSKIKMFENKATVLESKESQFETIKVLYKRKFDNVQEYQERKKQRIEKSAK